VLPSWSAFGIGPDLKGTKHSSLFDLIEKKSFTSFVNFAKIRSQLIFFNSATSPFWETPGSKQIKLIFPLIKSLFYSSFNSQKLLSFKNKLKFFVKINNFDKSHYNLRKKINLLMPNVVFQLSLRRHLSINFPCSTSQY